MQVPVIVNRASSFDDIKKHIIHLVRLNTSECKYITFGCSFTHGKRIDEDAVWTNILKKKSGIDFINASRCSAGLFQLVDNELEILPTILDADKVERVVIQRPLCVRYYWNSKKKKYNRNKAMCEFISLKPKLQLEVLKDIEKSEMNMLGCFKQKFKNAKFAIWRYWVDDHVQPTIAEYNHKLQAKVEQSFGMIDWGVIVEQEIVDFKLNKDEFGCRTHKQPHLFNIGWVAQVDDTHPAWEHNKIVAERVEHWVGT